ncbi:AcrR family transcriptional regulator [Agromyces sp. 3263]|uniref:TetR/AcrR family transcriptional regulator n=1 Tax=Agromyces sp. 3263 TaxID=2817750 RepID=UPI0028548149|nr:TetR/AcrR family transcriptional regulator [Agromyces sp. 3263]MDR6906543.1 AcrR family transcriptional regulator [Agromyces sp. 3263]
MSTEPLASGEPDRALRLLWRDRLGQPVGSRGPKQRTSVDAVVDAAITIADDEGIEALSMRRVAERLGLRPMSVYTYVPGKAELIDLMVDRVAGEQPLPEPGGSLRTRLEQVARLTWNEFLRHPWLLSIDTSRPPLGPNVSDRWEWSLRAIDGLGLSDVELDRVITLVTAFVVGPARAYVDAERLHRASTESDEEWWERNAPVLDRVAEPGRYPIAARVGRAVKAHDASGDPERAFAFGLARVIDGIESYVAARAKPGLSGPAAS